jgi:hypothetical protein
MSNSSPAYRAFTVIDRGENQDPYWLAIGAAFRHQSSDGFNVILQALPLPGPDGQCKIVLRPPKDDESRGETSGDREVKQAVREANDRRRGR